MGSRRSAAGCDAVGDAVTGTSTHASSGRPSISASLRTFPYSSVGVAGLERPTNCYASSSFRSTSSSSPASRRAFSSSHSARFSSLAPDVLVDLEPEPRDLVVVVQEPGHVLGAVLRGFGGEVPEAPEDLDADPPPESVGIGLDDRAQARVQVLARLAVAEDVDEALVVEPCRAELDPLLRHAHRPGEERVRVADAVAHADAFDAGQREPLQIPHGTMAIGFV